MIKVWRRYVDSGLLYLARFCDKMLYVILKWHLIFYLVLMMAYKRRSENYLIAHICRLCVFHKCRMDISLRQFHINKAIQTLCKQIEHCGVVSIFDRKIAWCIIWVVIKGRYKVINLYLCVCLLGGQTFHYHCQLKSQYLVHIKNCGKMAG